MDPATAFALTGTVLQFVDFGGRFVGLALRLYRGTTGDGDIHQSLHEITKDLDTILPKLNQAQDCTDAEKGLGQLALDCGKTAARLLGILQKVKPAENLRKRDALKAAFRLLYKEDEIKSLQEQLASFRNQLNLHLLLSLR